MHSRAIPFWISAFIHLAVICIGTVFLVKPPEFAIDAGHNSVEVNLVAAAPEPEAPTPPPELPPIPDTPPLEPPKPDDLVVPAAPTTPPPIPSVAKSELPSPPTPQPPKPQPKRTVEKGDGSAPKPGKDATSASSDAGAILDVKPDYLSNPPPLYPDASRSRKQEGVVVLEVIVNVDGRVDSLSIQSSSGFTPLDQSAVNAVRKWRFRPASLAGIKVKSHVVIPVRFRLGD